ncbi:3-oxoacyl-[acyl-carrier protein] reductase [hydrothermal vent metagenome]|uniref:3-oxoacyl-[acyl-carrier protein] reductase n=1 Tax=hydrothermal vent metagenome TaxID=652676 RepID=A0A1W1CFB7_9ZZZZ
MKRAIVTGASSGIGKAITERLLALGYFVIGVSRSIVTDDFEGEHFQALQCNLSDANAVQKLCKSLKKEDISILVNAAGFGRFEPHEELSVATITEMTFLNLTTPMLLTNATLRSLKQNSGYLININSIEALRASKFAAVYSATKAGLRAFGDALFEETRKSSLSITNINPDMTQSSFYDALRFDVSNKEEEKLLTSDIADAVEHILSMRKGAVISDYTIRSSKFGIVKKTKK